MWGGARIQIQVRRREAEGGEEIMSVKKMMIAYVIVTVLFVVSALYLVNLAVSEVRSRGLKNIVGEVWEGK